MRARLTHTLVAPRAILQQLEDCQIVPQRASSDACKSCIVNSAWLGRGRDHPVRERKTPTRLNPVSRLLVQACQTGARNGEFVTRLPGEWARNGIHAVITPTISMLEMYYYLPLVHVNSTCQCTCTPRLWMVGVLLDLALGLVSYMLEC